MGLIGWFRFVDTKSKPNCVVTLKTESCNKIFMDYLMARLSPIYCFAYYKKLGKTEILLLLWYKT